jgi:hypothetical protein
MSTFIDPSQIDSIPDERLKAQARELLKQFPHLAGETEEQPPQAFRRDSVMDDNVLDYTNFGPTTPPPPTQRPKIPEMKIDPVNHSFAGSMAAEEKKDEEVQSAPQRAAGTFDPTGKDHPILLKMRAVLGMTTKKYTHDVSVAGVAYTLEPLDGATNTRAVVLAAMNSLNDAEYRLNVDTAVVAYSCCRIDSVPIEDVFSVPTHKELEKDSQGRPVKYTVPERKEMAAQFFYNFLKSSPPALGDLLEQSYKQEFPPLQLLEQGQSYAHCPVPDCNYVRIVTGETAYCPYHGEQLVKEENLPNPS